MKFEFAKLPLLFEFSLISHGNESSMDNIIGRIEIDLARVVSHRLYKVTPSSRDSLSRTFISERRGWSFLSGLLKGVGEGGYQRSKTIPGGSFTPADSKQEHLLITMSCLKG